MRRGKTSGDSNIIKMPNDPRIAILGALKMIVLILLLAAIAGTIYVYQEDISIDNAKRLINYINLGASTAGKPREIELESTLQSDFALSTGGMAVVGGDMLYFVNPAGYKDMEVQLGYSRPALVSSDKEIVCYDRGGYKMCVANSYSVIKNMEFKSPILSAAMNDKGTLTVVTDEEGYKAAVTVFGKGQKQIFKWNTSENYVMLSAVSPDSKRIAAAAFSQDNGEITSLVKIFETGKDESICEIKIENEFVLGIAFVENNEICIAGETGTYLFDVKGEKKSEIRYSKGSLVAFAIECGSAPCIAVQENARDEAVRLYTLRNDGTERHSGIIRGEAVSVSAAGNNIAAVIGDTAYFFGADMEERKEKIAVAGAKEILQRSDGEAIVIFPDRAKFVSQLS